MGNKFSSHSPILDGRPSIYQVLDKEPKFSLWYRHSGQPEIDGIPEDVYLKNVLPQVDIIAPHLRHVRIDGSPQSGGNSSIINCLKNLPELKVLQIRHWQESTTELLDVISQITSLRELQLCECQLTHLPQSFSNLQNLERLNVQSNKFEGKLPTVIYQLSNLQSLDMRLNYQLTEIESDILKLSKLKDVDCGSCYSLQSPPYAVCKQDLPAIKNYFEDIRMEASREVAAVPVAVLGNMLAGKTSLIRSLKEGKRKLTFRQQSSPLDETTKVFNIEGLDLTDSSVQLIDYGGHQVYHMAYQLTLKQQCIPLIVISLEQFDKLVSERGPREATKLLCVDWLSHLYLACPQLGAPLLVLTHRDKLSDEEFTLRMSQLLTCSETIRTELLQEEEWSKGDGEFCQILNLSDTNKPLFQPDDIFVLSKDENINTLQSIKERIERRCAQFQVIIPRMWEEVSTYIDEQTAEPFIKLSDVRSKFPDEKNMDIIVGYLHNSGKVLWFAKIPSLSNYIFHQMPEIVKIITLVFHHSEDTIWDERIAKFTVFRHGERVIEKETFRHLVRQFRVRGLMDEVLLAGLLKTETNFTVEVAVELLRSFYIIHGPIQHKGIDTYIIPSFSSKSMSEEWETNGYIQLRADILFNGLSLPQYVYQLMTVAALRFYPELTDTVKVAQDGVTRLHGRRATHLVHDHSKRKVTLQISTPVEELGASWQRLIEFTRYILDKTTEVWKATRPVTSFYCSHCLFTRADNADQEVNPNWFRSPHRHDSDGNPLSSTTSFTGIEPVACCNADTNSTGELTVPKPLRFPCFRLTEEETVKLKRYLVRLEQRRLLSIPSGVATASAPSDESDISDVEEEGYVDLTTSRPEISLRLQPTRSKKILVLFDNPNKVYKMSDPVRGRVMIINNRQFYQDGKLQDTRNGSECDCANLSTLFKQLRFEMVKSSAELSDLKAEEIYSEIKQETERDEHHNYNMFCLVLMSHGSRGDYLYDCNYQLVDLVKVKDLLSPSNFPAMKGKPKLVIIQACSGERIDLGSVSATQLPSPTPTVAANQQPEKKKTPLEPIRRIEIGQTYRGEFGDLSQLDTLNADDFFVMKSTTESYKAVRFATHGSWFIRIFVATFYKHSCHRHIEELFKIIQDRVRKVSISYTKSTGKPVGGCVPDGRCTFTNLKKLYLFPGCPPK